MAFIPIALLAGFLWVASIIFYIVLIIGYIGTLILQIFLSRRNNPWVGLILPGITFGGMLFLICIASADVYDVLFWLGKGNIPTAIYLLIYFLCRRRKKKSNSASKTITGNGIQIGQK